MSKQTSIEWLLEQTRKADWNSLNKKEIFTTAKEMHKQEIIDSFNNGTKTRYFKTSEILNINTLQKGIETSEQYYKETYGS